MTLMTVRQNRHSASVLLVILKSGEAVFFVVSPVTTGSGHKA